MSQDMTGDGRPSSTETSTGTVLSRASTQVCPSLSEAHKPEKSISYAAPGPEFIGDLALVNSLALMAGQPGLLELKI